MTEESTNHDHQHDEGKEHSSGTRKVDDKQRSIAEWTTLAMSVLIIAGMVGGVTWLYFRGAEEPPTVVVETHLDEMREDDSGFYVPVTVINNGDSTVADAMVQGELDTGEGEPETAEITITYLAGGETVEGTFIFRSDPAEGELTSGVTSFKEP